jgi:glycosyltransferase involved in cell wall biosynthesis
MKVIFLITGLFYGGAETQLVCLATQLKARGWDVVVVSMLPPRAYVEELEKAGIPVYSLNMCRGIPDPRAVFRLARIIRKLRPHILHSHMIHSNILARIVRPLAPVPVLICTAHNIDERGGKVSGRWRILAYRFTDFLCDLTTQVSQAGFERYLQVGAVPGYKIRYIPNGIDTERFRPNPEVRTHLRKNFGFGDNFIWIAVGRFDPQKDYSNMLQAFAQVIKENSKTCLLIAGDGPLHPEMESLAKGLRIDANVKFLGIRQNVPELLNASDAYVMSSAWEGFGNVLVEAMACGCPVVSTDCPSGPAEILEGGKWGKLVPVGDVDGLADSILATLEGNNKFDVVKRAIDFNLTNAVESYLNIMFENEEN